MSDFEWSSSIGYLFIFLICCASIMCLCGIVIVIKNWLDNRREERERGRYVIQYTPEFEMDTL